MNGFNEETCACKSSTGRRQLVDAALWGSSMRDLLAARAAEVSYDDAVYMPALLTDKNGGPRIPDDIVAAACALTEVCCRTEERLILTPTDDLSNIRWKLAYARTRWCDVGFGDDLPGAWWDAIFSDLDRISANPNPDARLPICKVTGLYEIPMVEAPARLALACGPASQERAI